VEQSFIRVRGFFNNPNTQGLIAMLIFYPLVWWWRTEPEGTRRVALGALVIAWGGIVLLAGSRGSLLGVVGGGVVLLALYGSVATRYSVPLVIALLIAVGALQLVAPEFGRAFLIEGTDTSQAAQDSTAQLDRPFLIQRGIELGMRSPIWGVGFTASDQVFNEDHPYLISQGIYISGSHNSYTRLFVDLGVVGLLVAAPIFVIILGHVLVAPPRIKRDPTVAFMTAAVIAGLINAFFEGWLFGFGNSSTIPFWFFLALIPLRMTQLREADEQAAQAASDAPSPDAVPAEASA
jgi:O-antigen ligase